MSKGKFALDVKKLKYVSSDERCTVLEHKDGHQLVIAHRSLSPETKAQIDALAKRNQSKDQSEPKEPIKMADGGSVLPDPEEASARKFRTDAPDMMPAEPPVQPSSEDPFALPTGKGSGTYGAGAFGILDEIGTPNKLTQEQKDKIFALPTGQGSGTYGTLDQPTPESSGLGTDAVPLSALPAEMPQDQGLAAPGIAQPAVPGAFGAASSALDGYVKSQDEFAKEQERIQNDRIQAANDIKNTYDTRFNEIEQERSAIEEDIREGYIDPEKYWTGTKNPKTGQMEGGHSKVMSAIGMILAGFDPAGRPNAAINFLNQQMEKNLEAQKANLQSKHNLLGALKDKFADAKDQMDMARIIQNDMVQAELAKAQAKTITPAANLAVANAKLELESKKQELITNLAKRQTLAGVNDMVAQNPERIDAIADALEAAGDKDKAKDLRDRNIPGIGIAQTSKDATDLKEMRSGVVEAKKGLTELLELSKKSGKSLSLQDRAKARILQQTLVGALRLPITGPGAMNEGEREMLENLIANPTAIWSLDNTNKVKLQTLMNTLDSKFAGAAEARGVKLPAKMQPKTPGGQRQKAMQWLQSPAAKADPAKAAAIKKALGIQ